MADENEPMSNTKAISNYFGKREGQSLKDFMDEYKLLTPQDKDELGEGIRNGSLTY